MPQATIGALPSARVLTAVVAITLALSTRLVQVLLMRPIPICVQLKTAQDNERFGTVQQCCSFAIGCNLPHYC